MTIEFQIDEMKRLQRERRGLSEKVEDLETALKEAQDRLRTAAEALTDPQNTAGLEELSAAREAVQNIGNALAAAQAALRAFDDEHGTATEDLVSCEGAAAAR